MGLLYTTKCKIYSKLKKYYDIRECYVSLLQGNMVNLPEEENTPEKRVNKIFDIMDKVCIYNP